MFNKNLQEMTYNDLAFLSFGEAQTLLHEIEKLTDQLFDVAQELNCLKAENEGM